MRTAIVSNLLKEVWEKSKNRLNQGFFCFYVWLEPL